jgi:hypothetical protein
MQNRLTGFTVIYTTRGRFASGGIMNEYMDYITEKRRRNTEKKRGRAGRPGCISIFNSKNIQTCERGAVRGNEMSETLLKQAPQQFVLKPEGDNKRFDSERCLYKSSYMNNKA